MSIKIQINSLQALERLIGGDSELEVQIRNSVVQDFATKHLKAVANSEVVQAAMEDIKRRASLIVSEAVTKEICSFKQTYAGGGLYDMKLRPEVADRLAMSVKVTVDDLINTTVKRIVPMVDIEKIVDQRVEYYFRDYMDAEIRKRIDKVNAAMQAAARGAI